MMKTRLTALRQALIGSLLVASPHLLAEPVNADIKAQQNLAKMSLEEKIGLLHGPMTRLVSPKKRPEGIAVGAGYIAGNARLGIPYLVETDASLGVSNLLETRKGDVATALPSGLSLAASWDPELARRGGQMIGSEARAKGFNVMLVGGVNLVRDPRAGRNFEYLGEDPLLAGMMVGAQIDGVQSNHLIGTIKHLVLNDQETGRNVASVQMDEAAMRASDLLAIQIGIEQGNPGSVMCGYNRVNGIYSCEHPFLLTEVLRQDWDYKGFVMSDWGAVHSTEAILAGLDQQSGEQLDGKKYFSDLLLQAVKAGKIPESAVDKAAHRVLRTIYQFELDKYPVDSTTSIDFVKNAEVASQAAEQGIVLLKNEQSLLPLAATVQSIAVIGQSADLGVPSGGGSSQVTPVGGFKKLSRAFEKGPAALFALRGYSGVSPLDGIKEQFPNAKVRFADGSDIKLATELAKSSDVVLLFAEKYASEAADHEDISLGEGQDELINAIAVSNPRTVVILQTGNPVLMPWLNKVPAVVSAWYTGQQGGHAIARVLAGIVNPSGHLPVTFPASLAQLPNPVLPGSDAAPADKETRAVYGIQASTKPFDIFYPEGAEAGYRWFHQHNLQPLFPFGFGLSYSKFSYSNLKLNAGNQLSLQFDVTNTGTLTGADVPQVYVVRPDGKKRLIGWSKPELAPGQSETVRVQADMRVLADFDPVNKQWVVTPGTYQVEVAESALQPVLKAKVTLNSLQLKP